VICRSASTTSEKDGDGWRALRSGPGPLAARCWPSGWRAVSAAAFLATLGSIGMQEHDCDRGWKQQGQGSGDHCGFSGQMGGEDTAARERASTGFTRKCLKKAIPEIAITERCEQPWFNAADCGSGTDSFRMSRQASAVPHPSPRKNSWFGPVLRICGVANPRPQWQPLPEQVQQ